MLDFGWKKKAERLRMVILSAGHQIARELPSGFARILGLFRQTARTGDGSTLQAEIARLPPDEEKEKPMWEPIEIHGWEIKATMYRDNGQLWWLAHARRKNAREPSKSDVSILSWVTERHHSNSRRASDGYEQIDLSKGPRE